MEQANQASGVSPLRTRGKKLCHNCDTKPVCATKTDFIDRMDLLILGNLLKAKNCRKIPAYMARPLSFQQLTDL